MRKLVLLFVLVCVSAGAVPERIRFYSPTASSDAVYTMKIPAQSEKEYIGEQGIYHNFFVVTAVKKENFVFLVGGVPVRFETITGNSHFRYCGKVIQEKDCQKNIHIRIRILNNSDSELRVLYSTEPVR
ncbi:hypothetical protein ACFL0Z_02925 [Patescibacteria group bacterium]